DEKVRPPPTKPIPRPVAHRADDWLHEQTRDWPREPEDRYLVRVRAELRIDRAHVGELQAPAELDAEKAEAHIPDLPEAQMWFLHDDSFGSDHLSCVDVDVFDDHVAIQCKHIE